MIRLFVCDICVSSNYSQKEYRGALGTLLQLSSALGEMVTFSVGPFTSYRTFNIVFTSIIAIAMVPAFFLPESPSFLYSKGMFVVTKVGIFNPNFDCVLFKRKNCIKDVLISRDVNYTYL